MNNSSYTNDVEKYQYNSEESTKKSLYMQKRSNSCGCGTNTFFYKAEGESVYAVCASCGNKLKRMEDQGARKLLSQKNWREKVESNTAYVSPEG